jgi:putative phosphoesterase
MIGIMSDSHDNLDAIEGAMRLFREKGVSLIIHAGDFVAPFVFKKFKDFDGKLVGVFGNNDGERFGLSKKFSQLGCTLSDLSEFEHEGLRFCVYHGTVAAIVDALVASGRYDVVVRGHNHQAEVQKKDGVLLINPGETCGYLTGRRTVALLDPAAMKAEIVEIQDE